MRKDKDGFPKNGTRTIYKLIYGPYKQSIVFQILDHAVSYGKTFPPFRLYQIEETVTEITDNYK